VFLWVHICSICGDYLLTAFDARSLICAILDHLSKRLQYATRFKVSADHSFFLLRKHCLYCIKPMYRRRTICTRARRNIRSSFLSA
jgi:hypothetical protein